MPLLGDKEEASNSSLVLKIISMVIIAGISLLFGMIPLFCKACKNSVKVLGIANAFSGGIFLGIGLFHLLPESSEGFEKYFDGSTSIVSKLPLPYFIAFLSYSLILFIEKVAFDSHGLIHHEHDHGHSHKASYEETTSEHSHSHGGHGHAHEHGAEGHAHLHDEKDNNKAIKVSGNGHSHEKAAPSPKLPSPKFNPQSPSELQTRLISNDNNDECESEDEQEETIKNVISAKGRFASFLLERNISKAVNKSVVGDENAITSQSFIEKGNKSLVRASHILHNKKHFHNDQDLMVNNRVDSDQDKISEKSKNSLTALDQHMEDIAKSSSITPYILLIALSLHGFFEGIALGIQGTSEGTIFLALAIIAHKWAEAFTLGISFFKSKTEKNTFIKLICLFSAFTPAGITLGLFFTSQQLVEAIFLAISTGTFLYVACSEVIVEEFSVSRYKYHKFILFMIGGVLIGSLSLLEAANEDE